MSVSEARRALMAHRHPNRRHRRYERSRGDAGSRRGISGYTVRHVRCDRCLTDYMPQHTFRVQRWRWECGNCVFEHRLGYPVEPEARRRWKLAAGRVGQGETQP